MMTCVPLLHALTALYPCLSRSERFVKSLLMTLPSFHSMPTLISFPIWTLSGVVPCAFRLLHTSDVWLNTSVCSRAMSWLDQAEGLKCLPGSAQVSEYL